MFLRAVDGQNHLEFVFNSLFGERLYILVVYVIGREPMAHEPGKARLMTAPTILAKSPWGTFKKL